MIPPPGWALLFFLAAWFASRALDLPLILQSTIGGWAVFALGFAVSASGRLAFARADTEVVPVSKKNSALVTSGPFGVTRNPMYLGILTGLIGLAVVLGTIAGFVAAAAFFLFVNFISIPYEEEKMERQFGDGFRAYKKRVRRWI
jgi:protein-S-isoprenylcysteine O-methyltransferase Ste14